MSVYFATMETIQFNMLAGAIEDIRRIKDSSTICQDGKLINGALRERLMPWQRGQIVNSAECIGELISYGKWSIPRGAVNLSRQVLEAETQFREELQAASVSGMPWQGTFGKKMESCVRCGRRSSWRFILKPPSTMPPEMAWRLKRPENAVPICRRCVAATKFEKRDDIRFDMAWGLWSARFEALHRWYLAIQNDWSVKGWDKEQYPLWPKEFGGNDWKTGSGAYVYSAPQPPKGVHRSAVHFAALNRAMGVATKRHEKIGPYFSPLQLSRINETLKLEAGEYYCERGCIYRGASPCSDCSRNRNSISGLNT